MGTSLPQPRTHAVQLTLTPGAGGHGEQGFGLVPLRVAPMQFHALVIAVFASVIAPFGGFFASGVKRAYDLKVQTVFKDTVKDTACWAHG